MITVLLLLVTLGLILGVIITGCVILLDPIIAILCVYLVYRLIKKLTTKNRK